MRGVQSSRPAAFEVHCDRCRVTFPVGTRRCIHCGGPMSASRKASGLRVAPDAEPVTHEAELEPEPVQRRFVSPTTLLWIALIAGGYLYRACSGQAP
jgi:ribosomal protein L37E